MSLLMFGGMEFAIRVGVAQNNKFEKFKINYFYFLRLSDFKIGPATIFL